MIEAFRKTLRLRRLQGYKQKIEREYDEKIKAAREAGNWELEQELMHQLFTERDLIDYDIRKIISRDLMAKAERYMIPIPEYRKDSPDWEESQIDGRHRLSTEALARLRSEFRRERKERHEYLFMWAAALTGVIGAVTGLVAVIGG